MLIRVALPALRRTRGRLVLIGNFFDADGGPPDRATLSADHIADAIVWVINQPTGVDVNTRTIRPVSSPL